MALDEEKLKKNLPIIILAGGGIFGLMFLMGGKKKGSSVDNTAVLGSGPAYADPGVAGSTQGNSTAASPPIFNITLPPFPQPPESKPPVTPPSPVQPPGFIGPPITTPGSGPANDPLGAVTSYVDPTGVGFIHPIIYHGPPHIGGLLTQPPVAYGYIPPVYHPNPYALDPNGPVGQDPVPWHPTGGMGGPGPAPNAVHRPFGRLREFDWRNYQVTPYPGHHLYREFTGYSWQQYRNRRVFPPPGVYPPPGGTPPPRPPWYVGPPVP